MNNVVSIQIHNNYLMFNELILYLFHIKNIFLGIL